jgi:UDP-2,3-diacylglucosamine hydrolase
VEGASRAGLAGIAVESGAALVVDREQVAAAADAAGIFIYGFTEAELS